MIVHVPDVLSPQQLSWIRSEMAAAEWVDGRQSVGDQGAKVKRNRQLREGSDAAERLGAVVLDALRANPVFFSAALPLRISPPMFNRYEDGETYGMHVDGSVRTARDGVTQIRTDVSCTLFLEDPASYDGGELEVADTYGSHEVKLPAGDLVLYPSTSLHRVTPVTRGARVACFFWIQSMVRDTQRRSMLFELDQTIFKLRQQLGDNAEVLSLTGHYHNLLRQWSET